MNVRTYVLNTKQAQLIADALDVIQPNSAREQIESRGIGFAVQTIA